jgi:hypothetical protein
MKAGDHGQGFIRFNDEHQRIGKAAKQSASHVLVDHGELPGMAADALDAGVECCAEAPA